MNQNNFDEEEASDDELKSVAYTASSVMIIFISVMIWFLFT